MQCEVSVCCKYPVTRLMCFFVTVVLIFLASEVSSNGPNEPVQTQPTPQPCGPYACCSTTPLPCSYSCAQPCSSENKPQSLFPAEVMGLIKSVTDTSAQTIEVAKREMENQGKLTEGLLRIDNKLLREIKEHYEQYTYWLTLAASLVAVILGAVGYIEYLARRTLKQAADTLLTKANKVAEDAATALTTAKGYEQEIGSIRTGLKEVHKDAELRTRYNECRQLSGAARVLKVLGQIDKSEKSETAQMVTSMLKDMLAAANKGIELTEGEVPGWWWMVFRVMKGVALKDSGNYEAALAEMEQVLVARELKDEYKSAPFYNAACTLG